MHDPADPADAARTPSLPGAHLFRRPRAGGFPGDTELAVRLAGAPSLEGFCALLEALPAHRGLRCFDPGYPSPSDPGAYATLWRVGREFFVKLGNHGWSTLALPVSCEVAAALLLGCTRAHGSGTPGLVLVDEDIRWERPAPAPPRWRPFRRRRFQRRRVAQLERFRARIAELRAG